VDDMELIAAEAGLNLVEIIREPGRELVADLTPTEMRLIVSMREHPKFMHSMAETLRSIEEYAKAKPGRRTIRERMADDQDE
jgi:hypothetical protein